VIDVEVAEIDCLDSGFIEPEPSRENIVPGGMGGLYLSFLGPRHNYYQVEVGYGFPTEAVVD